MRTPSPSGSNFTRPNVSPTTAEEAPSGSRAPDPVQSSPVASATSDETSHAANKAKLARENAINKIAGLADAFKKLHATEYDGALKFDDATEAHANDLINQGELVISKEDEERNHTIMTLLQNASDELGPGYTSHIEAAVTWLIEAPYRDLAAKRIDALSNAPKTAKEFAELTDCLEQACKDGKITRDTARIYADALNRHEGGELKENIDGEYQRRYLTTLSGNHDDLFVALAHDTSYYVRESLTQNKNLPAAALRILAADKDMDIAINAVYHANRDDSVVAVLLKHPHFRIPGALARDQRTPLWALEELEKLEDGSVLIALLQNERIPQEMRSRIHESDMEEVKLYFAQNNRDKEMLEVLSKSNDPLIRWGVANELATPLPVLQTLTEDPDEEVRIFAQGTLDLLRWRNSIT